MNTLFLLISCAVADDPALVETPEPEDTQVDERIRQNEEILQQLQHTVRELHGDEAVAKIIAEKEESDRLAEEAAALAAKEAAESEAKAKAEAVAKADAENQELEEAVEEAGKKK